MSNLKSTYPPCPNGVYSLRRLYSRLTSCLASSTVVTSAEPISVGGRVHCGPHRDLYRDDGYPQLFDAGGRLELPQDFCQKTGAQHHETWLVTFCAGDLDKQNDLLRVSRISDAVRLTAPRRELNWSPPPFADVLAWGSFVERIRNHLKSRRLQEVATPSLVTNPGMEPELEPFSVEINRRMSAPTRLFLPTSPELHLKQFLALGFTDIFEIKPVFRKEELTDIHEAEFHMLEWYRGYANLDMIAEDLTDLLVTVVGLDAGAIRNTTIRELFNMTGYQLKPDTTAEELRDLASRLKLQPNHEMDWNDLFHLIWVAKVEPNLPPEPLIVRDYPPSQAALARLNLSGWADRLEFYWQGIEIANAFHELNDPIMQRERFIRDQKKRVEYGRTPLEIDENFMAALEYGLPPSGGIALGMDRLFMLSMGKKTLRELRAFPFSHQFRSPGEPSERRD